MESVAFRPVRDLQEAEVVKSSVSTVNELC
ncbi:MAG: hypothetical protein K0S00_2684 [Xanthobacteraceae bacterium]|jgi:hypothetical protein|nr:hypothetical protein [Xanthobacteraceae bacterium]